MSFDWEKVQESKEALRLRLASLPFAEKLRLLDVLRERALVSVTPGVPTLSCEKKHRVTIRSQDPTNDR